MSRGKILVQGTCSSIKSQYGIGYEFSFCDLFSNLVEEIEKMVSEEFSDISLDLSVYEMTKTATLVVPISQLSRTNSFIKRLESRQISFGIKSNSLEEAFIKMGEKEHKASSKELQDTQKIIEEISKIEYKKSLKNILYVLFIRRFILLLKTPIQIVILGMMVSFPAFTIHFTFDNFWQEISYEGVYKQIASTVFMGCVSLLCSVFVFLPGYERNKKMRYIMKKLGVTSLIYYVMLLVTDLIIGFFMCFLCFALISILLRSVHGIKMAADFWVLIITNLIWLSTYIAQSNHTTEIYPPFNHFNT